MAGSSSRIREMRVKLQLAIVKCAHTFFGWHFTLWKRTHFLRWFHHFFFPRDSFSIFRRIFNLHKIRRVLLALALSVVIVRSTRTTLVAAFKFQQVMKTYNCFQTLSSCSFVHFFLFVSIASVQVAEVLFFPGSIFLGLALPLKGEPAWKMEKNEHANVKVRRRTCILLQHPTAT